MAPNPLWKAPMKLQPIRKERLPGRNEKCPCGSGKKAKKCCLNKIKAAGRLATRRPRAGRRRQDPRPLAHRGADATQPRKDRFTMRHATLLLILVLAGCQPDPLPRPILVPVPRPRPIIVPVPVPRPRPIIVPEPDPDHRCAGDSRSPWTALPMPPRPSTPAWSPARAATSSSAPAAQSIPSQVRPP